MLDALLNGCDRPAPRGLCSLEPITTAALISGGTGLLGKFLGGGGGGGAAPSVTKQENQQITNVNVTLGDGGGGAAARLQTGLYTVDPSLGAGGYPVAVGGDYLVNSLEGFPSPITGTASNVGVFDHFFSKKPGAPAPSPSGGARLLPIVVIGAAGLGVIWLIKRRG